MSDRATYRGSVARKTRSPRPNLAKLKRDAALAASLGSLSEPNRSGERGFALSANDQKTVVGLSGEHVLLILEPG